MDGQKENFQFLLEMQGRIWMLKYGSLILLILMATNVVLHYRDNRRHLKEKEQLMHELNVLKAKVYDFQEAGKSKSSTQAPK
jgi:protein subunit release factor A